MLIGVFKLATLGNDDNRPSPNSHDPHHGLFPAGNRDCNLEVLSVAQVRQIFIGDACVAWTAALAAPRSELMKLTNRDVPLT